MQDAAVNAVNAVPAVVDQFVMIVRFVKNDFCFDAASRWFELGVMLDQFTNDAAILVQCFHLTINSFSGSKTIKGSCRSSSAGRAIGSCNSPSKTYSGTAK